MKSDEDYWPELATVFENLLCPPLSKPLSRHGSLRNSLNTLANALCTPPDQPAVPNARIEAKAGSKALIASNFRRRSNDCKRTSGNPVADK